MVYYYFTNFQSFKNKYSVCFSFEELIINIITFIKSLKLTKSVISKVNKELTKIQNSYLSVAKNKIEYLDSLWLLKLDNDNWITLIVEV